MATSLKKKAEALMIIDKLRYSPYYHNEEEVNADIDKLRELVKSL
jgi:hypothetical protein